MSRAMRKVILLLLLSLPAAASAQGDVEYLMEVGGGLGLMSYMTPRAEE